MTLPAILLLTVAAALHASWNFISKRGTPSTAFMLVATMMGSLMLGPVAMIYARQYALFTPHVWVLIVVTGVFQAVYFAALAGAYRAGDMSLAYPLARSSPVIVVMVVTFMLGQGDAVSRSCALGVMLVVAGCFMVPMKTFRDFHLKNYLCGTCALALLAAVGTAGYSIVDSEALASLRQHLGPTDSIVVITLLYALVEALSASIFMLLYVAARRTEREELIRVLKMGKQRAIIAGICIYLTYSLVLISMSMARNVSYIVGFRQLSIPLGVLMGITFLKEPLTRPKVCGVAILVLGLVLIAVG